MRNVAACPRCVASYGVMPHVYMRTVSPGSKGTTCPLAVSYSRIDISLTLGRP